MLIGYFKKEVLRLNYISYREFKLPYLGEAN
jgi:hypothetical protein